VYEYVAGDTIEPMPGQARREPPPHPQTGERIDFTAAFDRAGSFTELTRQAVRLARKLDPKFGRLLRMLSDCTEVGPEDAAGHRSQSVGAMYKQLAYIAHLAGLDGGTRQEWYSVAESIPMSQRHAGHLIKKLKEGNA